MSFIAFSLTEKAVIDPILTLRAPLPPLAAGQETSWTAEVWHAIQSEVVTRIVAVFTSVLAVIDTLTHLLAGMYKGACLLVSEVCCLDFSDYSMAEVEAHFGQMVLFAELTLVGSIAAIVWPDIFASFGYSLPSPPPPPPPAEDLSAAPVLIQELAEAVLTDQHQAPFELLQQIFNQSSPEDKHWFVQVFNQAGFENFKAVRTELAAIVYQPLQPNYFNKRQVKWLSAEDVDQRAGRLWQQANIYKHAFYFHATKEPNLQEILKSKKIEVRQLQMYRGAFVSTLPETLYGRYILAFRRNIERLSPLENGLKYPHNNSYWAGFSRAIPVTESTLAYIILDYAGPGECQTLEARCQVWAGRAIKVIPMREAQEHLQAIQGLEMGVPAEWPSQGDVMRPQVLPLLQASAAVFSHQAH